VSDFYAFDVGDGVVGAGCAVEGDAEVAGSGLGLGDGESAGTEKSAEKHGQERECARSDHKCGSIKLRRQYIAWKSWFRILLGKAAAVRR
jgi:hypothetical protein